MQCPECKSTHIRKNGHRRGKQNHICVGFRAIERVKGVHHTTLISWVRPVGELLSDDYDPQTTPDLGELDVACFP